MDFVFICPHCKTQLEAQEEWEGMEVQCTVCNQTIIIPEKGPAVSVKPPESSRQNPKQSATDEKEEDEGSVWYGLIGIAFIGLIIWLLWIFIANCPILSFWILAPIAAFLILCFSSGSARDFILKILCFQMMKRLPAFLIFTGNIARA